MRKERKNLERMEKIREEREEEGGRVGLGFGAFVAHG